MRDFGEPDALILGAGGALTDGLIPAAVGVFRCRDLGPRNVMLVTAVVVVVGFVTVGAVQPTIRRRTATRYRTKALRVAAPRIWFGRTGVYDEAFGHTSFKPLVRVVDQTATTGSITLTILVRVVFGSGTNRSGSDFEQAVPIIVPTKQSAVAAALVTRYRSELVRE